MDKIAVSEKLTVGSAQPDQKELHELAQEGFRTVINLRTADEEDLELAPDEEAEIARSEGLDYVHLPVSSESLSSELVDQFREEVERRPGPIFVHCAAGKRSGALSMLHEAAKKDLSGDEVLKKAEEMGFECDSENLVAFVKRYADRHAQH